MSNIPRIVVVGSLNMDLVVSASAFPQKGETIAGSAIHYIPGGKGANQAVACARLGAEVKMIGAVGNDQFGDSLLRGLEQEGIDRSAVAVMPETATGVASIIHAEQDNSIIVVPGANGEVTPELIEQHRQHITDADVLLVQLEIPIPAVEMALRIAKKAGIITVLNPAPAKQLSASLLALVDYITPNETEFEVLRDVIGLESDQLKQHLQSWADAGLPPVVLTLGSKGALLYEGDKATVKQAPAVEVVDTTGAGDCLNGAFATCLAKEMTAEQALQFAVVAASQSVTVFGAQAGMPTWEQVKKLTLQHEN